MRPIIVLVIMGMFIGWIASIYNMDKSGESTRAIKSGAALNYLQYRMAAMRYVFFHKTAPDGVLPKEQLEPYLPLDWAPAPGHEWHARIANGYLFVWGKTTPKIVIEARNMTGMSLAIGESIDGKMEPASVALPDFIPDGSVVSVTGTNRFKPNNKDYPSSGGVHEPS